MFTIRLFEWNILFYVNIKISCSFISIIQAKYKCQNEIADKKEIFNISTPFEATIRGVASFCMAEDCQSFVFVGT